MSQQTDNNLILFRELITCCHNLFFWTLDRELQPIYSNCPSANAFRIMFVLDLTPEVLLDYAQKHHTPMILTNSFGLTWIAAPEHSELGDLHQIHILGPALYDDVSMRNLEDALNKHPLSIPLKRDLMRMFERLPVISMIRFAEYGQMLHYCITGEKIISYDMNRYPAEPHSYDIGNAVEKEQHGTWAAEQEILKLVETGNLNYRTQMAHLISMGSVGKLSNGDPLRQAKNAVIVFIALCTRAAIRGGLSPETAFTLSDQYIQSLEACDSFPKVYEVNASMMDDFVMRVHRCQSNNLTPQIQKCCDYIHLHLKEKINIEQLAGKFGYSKYYFSKKFKQETGFGIREYINNAKIEEAKVLLKIGKYSIQDVSELLGFHSQSYFGEIFHNATGLTPKEYREKK